jgi:hypothetical protein
VPTAPSRPIVCAEEPITSNGVTVGMIVELVDAMVNMIAG